jgi:anti-anti-sigma factor
LPVTFADTEEYSVVRLEGEIDIACAAELKAALLEAVSLPKPVRLDLERAAEFDVTAVQLLWAAAREVGNSGTALLVAKGSADPVSQAAREVGLMDLGLQPAGTALAEAVDALAPESVNDR